MNKLKIELREKKLKSKSQNDCENINFLQAMIKFFGGKAVEAARNLAIRTPDSKRTLSDMDNGALSLIVDEDIVLVDAEEGVQSLPEDELDEGLQSLPEDELDEGLQSIPEDELDKGVQSLCKNIEDIWLSTTYILF